MNKEGPNVTIKGGVLANVESAAIVVDDKNSHLVIDGTDFLNNPQDLVAKNGMRKLTVENCRFDPQIANDSAGKSKKYFGGMDVDENGNIIRR